MLMEDQIKTKVPFRILITQTKPRTLFQTLKERAEEDNNKELIASTDSRGSRNDFKFIKFQIHNAARKF